MEATRVTRGAAPTARAVAPAIDRLQTNSASAPEAATAHRVPLPVHWMIRFPRMASRGRSDGEFP